MSLSNSNRSYGAVAKSFHWLTALLIFSAIPLGLIANDLAHQIEHFLVKNFAMLDDARQRRLWCHALAPSRKFLSKACPCSLRMDSG